MAVSVDLSEKVIQAAQVLLNSSILRCNGKIAPISLQSSMPPSVYFTWKSEFVYFAELTAAQLIPGGAGHGEFGVDASVPAMAVDDEQLLELLVSRSEPGTILRWGLRTKCVVVPNLADNLLPESVANLTYGLRARALHVRHGLPIALPRWIRSAPQRARFPRHTSHNGSGQHAWDN
ncbi:hypothetical protein HYPSUDRAFT_202004 [Hypholoma sublateritium FD-334 SS-4]|uniref:Uncharacterized protein n=1 Tax=Hypholoma sublateritium (strain FD-334 SS-4) TaxID=945553 RepID=A0A0D2L6S5_HYPSF|nr:hypothetical protein HYPSUDRAFT_202004 [Hypholoma sublateritium FD-334 SS-4]